MHKLSVILATFNEEKNLGPCLEALKDIADEFVIVDGTSTDKTVAIAKSYGARVLVRQNEKIFHINKQKALDMARNEWVLQMDADEIVSKELAKEIMQVITMTKEELEAYQEKLPNKKLFLRHQKLLADRDGNIGTEGGDYAAFFIPRLNYFLGKYLRYGGVYPDGVIRLIKKSKSHFPCVSVHEQIAVDGRVGWLQHDLLHMADPTFERYLKRNSRYINLIVDELKQEKHVSAFAYMVTLPLGWFFATTFRHKGILDGWQGVTFSFFSALRFPRAYLRYKKQK
ncbi:MAG: glycosyltransferase family 2 protein [Patescibacteria group bacterium]